jgi:hypothetical protein
MGSAHYFLSCPASPISPELIRHPCSGPKSAVGQSVHPQILGRLRFGLSALGGQRVYWINLLGIHYSNMHEETYIFPSLLSVRQRTVEDQSAINPYDM